MQTKIYFLILLFQILATHVFAQGFLVTYPQEPGAVLSANYTVFVNETPVAVYNVGDNRDVSYAHFAFAGKVTIRIHVSSPVSTYNLSPHSFDIESTKSGQDIYFDLDRPRKFLLKEVNDLDEHLCIFADPLEENNPEIGDSLVTNVMDKGVDNTGSTNDIAIIQDAISNLPAGGILYFPPGHYILGGDLVMKSDRSIYLAGGATLQASSTKELRIIFSGANNVKLFGRGSIDGRGDSFRPNYKNNDGTVAEGGNTILYCNTASNNCTIEGIVLKNAITWTSIVMYTKNWNVYNMKVVNGRKFTNHDCWDPHDAVNMMFDNCFLYGTDDAIAYSILSPNLDLNTTIRNSVFYNGEMGTTVRIGPWVGDNCKNITVENNDHILGGNNDFTLSFYLGGSISDLKYLNNRIENAQKGVLLIRTNWEDYYTKKTESGSADNIIFDRLSVENASVGWNGHFSRIEGEKPHNFVSNITFKDFYQKGVLQTSTTSADIEIVGKYVSNVIFTSSITPVIDIIASNLIAYRSGSNPGKFTVSRTGGNTLDSLTVKYIIHGTAINGTDYTAIPDSVVIPVGSETTEIIITPDATNTANRYKTVFISLSSNSNYILGPGYHAVVTILNGNLKNE